MDTTKKPEMVPYNLTEALRTYLYRSIELGAVEGAVGEQRLSKELEPIFAAVHAVLAGGKVEVKVLDGGNDTVRNELTAQLSAASDAANELNRQAGTYVTAAL